MATDEQRKNLAAASIIGASILVSACALAGIAWFLGWTPDKPSVSAPVSIAQPGSQLAGSAPPDAGLLPGETVVDTQPRPVTPSYSNPSAPKPVEAPPAEPPASVAPPPSVAPSPSVAPPPPAPAPRAAAAPVTPSYAKRADARPVEPPPAAPPPPPPAPSATGGPVTPSYARRAEPRPVEPKRAESIPVEPQSLCVNCGVISTVIFTSDTWDVAVRFEDGSREVFRYPERPRFRAGDKVRVEGERLELDK